MSVNKAIISGLFVFYTSIGFFAQSLAENSHSVGQSPSSQGQRLPITVNEKGDTLPMVILPYVFITDERVFSSKKDARSWSKLKRDVSKVYPYSKLASKKLKEYKDQMAGLSPAEQKKLLKVAEKEIIAEFKDDVQDMSLNQGRILIKLIDRETGNTSYDLVKELRGSLQAFFWQSIARVFSANLKTSYDPYKNKEDRLIEDIVTSIEDGSFVN